MREDSTNTQPVDAQITAYADGVINLRLSRGDEFVKIEVDEVEAGMIASLIGEEIDVPDAEPPERWG